MEKINKQLTQKTIFLRGVFRPKTQKAKTLKGCGHLCDITSRKCCACKGRPREEFCVKCEVTNRGIDLFLDYFYRGFIFEVGCGRGVGGCTFSSFIYLFFKSR